MMHRNGKPSHIIGLCPQLPTWNAPSVRHEYCRKARKAFVLNAEECFLCDMTWPDSVYLHRVKTSLKGSTPPTPLWACGVTPTCCLTWNRSPWAKASLHCCVAAASLASS